MKKILFLINTLCGGGAEKVLVDIVNNLDSKKYDITIQTVIDDGVHIGKLAPHIKYKTIIKTRNKFVKKALSYLVNFIIPSKVTYKLFISDNYDLEIAFLEGIPTKLLAESKKNKIAWVHTDLVNNDGHKKNFKTIDAHIECYKKYNSIVCVSESVREAFADKFGINQGLRVIYNLIDSEEVKAKSKAPVSEWDYSNQFTVLSVGRLSFEKGHDRLLNVHNRLINEGIEHQLCLIGDGEKKEQYMNYIEANNLRNSTKIIGFNDNPYKFMGKSNIFVCPSRAEGFSLVVAEAMICGVPVISTDCAGPRELLGNSEFGLLVDNNEEALYHGLKSLIKNSELYNHYETKAKERAKMFDKQKSINEIEVLIERVCSN